jgi:NAD(P)-dependent dehydrogenase (short-subunit alcohol dehydrogenase family)
LTDQEDRSQETERQSSYCHRWGDRQRRAIGLAFADEGAAVVAAARNIARLEKVGDHIKVNGGKAKAIQTDISDHEQVKRMVAETVEEFGKLDIPIKNAAALAHRRGITEEDMWRKLKASNSLNRIAEPEELARAVVFLASDDSSAMTGHSMIVSCGFHLVHPQELHKL